ncbi:hypothetical protein BST15_17375, partial [Mycolicibacter arupensis]
PIPTQPHAPQWQPAAPASFSGNVGPVGSQVERNQLGLITGKGAPASVAEQLLLGPVARGTAVSFVPAGTGGRK